MAVSQELISANVVNQINLVRLSTGEARTLLPFLRQIVEYLEGRLAKEGDSIESKKRLDILLHDVKLKLDSIYTKWDEDFFQEMLPEVAIEQALFQANSINAVVADYESVIPATTQIVAAATRNPLVLGSNNKYVDFKKYTTGWKKTEIDRVADAISGGFYTGLTPTQITRNITGLKSQGYKNGIINVSRNNIYGMVKNSINHMSVMAKEQFDKENNDLIIGYEIVATLDSKTSTICRFEDGKKYYYKDGNYQPKPPFHDGGCRTTTAPLLDPKYNFLDKGATRPSVTEKDGKAVAQQVSANTTYYEWAKNQPALYMDDALGKTRARIMRNSGLTPEEFRKASTNQFGKSITLKDMAQKNSQINDYLKKLSKVDKSVDQFIAQ